MSRAIIGDALTGAALLINALATGFLVYDVFRPERRRQRIRREIGKAYFVVPQSFYHPCDYARQNEHEHLLNVIAVRPDIEINIDIVVLPNVDLEIDTYSFGTDGDPGERSEERRFLGKPYATSVCNRFIEAGEGRIIEPGQNNNDYLDKHHYYHHIVANRRWSAEMHRAIGFRIKTGQVGKYDMILSFAGDVVSGHIKGDLTIVVEEEPRDRIMKCLRREHMSYDCAVGIRPIMSL
jgi:hypothetical protein